MLPGYMLGIRVHAGAQVALTKLAIDGARIRGHPMRVGLISSGASLDELAGIRRVVLCVVELLTIVVRVEGAQ